MNNGLFDPDTETRFNGFVARKGVAECWLWQARISTNGYGSFKIKSRPVSAHRVALMLHLGRQLETGEHVLHSCDSKLCCNPAHLRAGSNAENRREAVERGRVNRWAGRRAGDKNPAAKLNSEQVGRIRSSAATCDALAAEFGVSFATISAIRSGRAWVNG